MKERRSATGSMVRTLTALGLGLLAFHDRSFSAAGPLFVEAAAETGLTFTHVNGATGQVLSCRGDGRRRRAVRLRQRRRPRRVSRAGRPLDGSAPLRPLPTSRLFRNDLTVGADGTRTLHFTDVTDAPALALRAYGMGAAVGDYDNDGDLDLLRHVVRSRHALSQQRRRHVHRRDRARPASSDPLWSTSAAFVDYDRDGDLDLFVANYLDFTVAGNKRCTDSVGARDYCGPRAYRPVPDRLYRNDGNGHFTDVTEAAGISKADGAGLGVVGRRLQRRRLARPLRRERRDAEPALDQPARRHVRRRRPALRLGAERRRQPRRQHGHRLGRLRPRRRRGSLRHQHRRRDVRAVRERRARQFRGRARPRPGWRRRRPRSPGSAPTGSITTTTAGSISSSPTAPSTSIEAQRGQPSPFRMTNQLFHNTAGGRFEDDQRAGGPAFARAEIGRGAAFGDIDNDGDIDIVVTNNGGPVRLLLNQAAGESLAAGRASSRRRATASGSAPGRRRAGWRADVVAPRAHRRQLPVSERRRARTSDSARPPVRPRVVQWPDGQRERWANPGIDRIVTVTRGTGACLVGQDKGQGTRDKK